MLRIVNLEEIQGMLLRIPDLINLQERRDSGFVEEVKRWIATFEKVLVSNRMPVTSNVATFRGVLISAEGGVIPPGVEFHGRPTKRKIREAAAAYVLRQTGDLISSVIQKDYERIVEAERLTRQLIAMAKAKGLVQPLPGEGDHMEKLRALWRILVADPDIGAGTVNVEGLVGPYDALIVLDRTMVTDTPSE